MRKTLLIAAVLSMTVTATWADGSASKYDTAIDATRLYRGHAADKTAKRK